MIRRQNDNVKVYPVALRKAKIVFNFGLSECSRVKSDIVPLLALNERIKVLEEKIL